MSIIMSKIFTNLHLLKHILHIYSHVRSHFCRLAHSGSDPFNWWSQWSTTKCCKHYHVFIVVVRLGSFPGNLPYEINIACLSWCNPDTFTICFCTSRLPTEVHTKEWPCTALHRDYSVSHACMPDEVRVGYVLNLNGSPMQPVHHCTLLIACACI